MVRASTPTSNGEENQTGIEDEFSPNSQITALQGVFRYIFPLTMPTFYELFCECAERWPDSVALEIQQRDRVERNTYAEARRMAESIGRWLTESGFQPGARIAILADNHPRWITAYLGIIAAGCAAVPLDTAFHTDQVAKLLKDSGSSLLFCDRQHLAVARAALGESTIGILLLDSPYAARTVSAAPAAELRSAGQPGAAVPTRV